MSFSRQHIAPISAALLTLSVVGCSSSGDNEGSVRLLLDAEEIVVEGIAAGDGADEIQDGWDVEFERYVVSIGGATLSSGADVFTSDEVWMADLTQLGNSGLEVGILDGLPEGRLDFGYQIVTSGAQRHESVSEELFKELTEAERSYSIVGELTNEEGRSCPPASLASPGDSLVSEGANDGMDPCYPMPSIRFAFDASLAATYGPCEIDGVPGLAVASGSESVGALSLHVDHLFFNGFPEGDEGGILRLAQWLADCDLNLDGEVSWDELDQIKPTDLPAMDERFQLGGTPISPLDTMSDYVRAQLLTQGHFQGEGECPLDGVEIGGATP